MPIYEASIQINAAADSVWKNISAVTQWPEWMPTVSRVEPLGEASMSLAAQYKVTQPKLSPAVYTVTSFQPKSRFVWETKSPGVRTVADHIIEELEPQKVKVTLRVQIGGPLGSLFGFLAATMTRNYLQQEAISLKHRVEQEK